MPKTYKLTPVDQLPGRRTAGERSIYLDALDDALKGGNRLVRIEVPGRKPASVTAALKDAIGRNPRRYGKLAVHQRGEQVYLERRETTRRHSSVRKAA